MKSQVFFFIALMAFGLGSSAFASELADDLRTPFQDLTNPFEHVSESALPSSEATELKQVLESCAYIPEKTKNGQKVQLDSAVRPACQSQLLASYEQNEQGQPSMGNQVELRLGAFALKAVSWDGSQSDGGDEQAVAVYDQAGNRLAVYPALFVDGNVIDALAMVTGAQLPKIEE